MPTQGILIRSSVCERVTDSKSNPVYGAKRYIYHAGTTNLAPIFSDYAMSNSAPNPQESTMNGYFPQCWISRTIMYDIETLYPNGTRVCPVEHNIQDDINYQNLIANKGDMVYGDASGNAARLPIGNKYQSLIANGIPQYQYLLQLYGIDVGSYMYFDKGQTETFGGSQGIFWLLCSGQEVSRTIYSTLFAVIGTKYGTGDGVSTFNLPDPRGRTIVTAGQGTDLTNRNIADKFGEEKHKMTMEELVQHSHHYISFTGTELSYDGGASACRNGNASTEETGNGEPFNVIQPSIVIGDLYVCTGVV